MDEEWSLASDANSSSNRMRSLFSHFLHYKIIHLKVRITPRLLTKASEPHGVHFGPSGLLYDYSLYSLGLQTVCHVPWPSCAGHYFHHRVMTHSFGQTRPILTLASSFSEMIGSFPWTMKLSLKKDDDLRHMCLLKNL